MLKVKSIQVFGVLFFSVFFIFPTLSYGKINPKSCTVKINDDDITELHSLRRKVYAFNKKKGRTCVEEIKFEQGKKFNIKLKETLIFSNTKDGDEYDNDGIYLVVQGRHNEGQEVILDLTGLNLGISGDKEVVGLKISNNKARFNYLTLVVADEKAAPYAISNSGTENTFQQVRIVNPGDQEIATVASDGKISVISEPEPDPVQPDPVEPSKPNSDGDTIVDEEDNCDEVDNEDQSDFDGDGLGDACDDDNDDDAKVDADDNCAPKKDDEGNFVGTASDTYNPDQENSDFPQDNLGDTCDPDSDGDGIPQVDPNGTPACSDASPEGCIPYCQTGQSEGCYDNCASIANPDQLNEDGDQWGKACDPNGDTPPFSDVDGDGINFDPMLDVCQDGETENCSDNCPTVANPDQLDNDGDYSTVGGDACDPDDDNDGILDDLELSSNPPTDPFNPDTDSDGIPDEVDNCPVVANPLEAGVQPDADEDGDGDACDEDTIVNTPTSTPEVTTDLDGDGVNDDVDNCVAVANSDQADSDGDQIGDACDPDNPQGDSDNDGVVNETDNCPFIGNSDQSNADGDDLGDACDPDFNEGGGTVIPEDEGSGGCFNSLTSKGSHLPFPGTWLLFSGLSFLALSWRRRVSLLKK